MSTPTGPVRLRDEMVAGPGGAMTDGLADITAEYTGAEETCTLTGSPVPVPPNGLRALHDQALTAVRAGQAAEAPRT
ncbi:hypothetical protein ACIRQQ_39015 [Streptomyces fuscichromogenes]|uniref:hypothetical protein n=1 Tax=Streptomyces fuscichromogenes TaxID=1324013 RepID=UPI0037FE865D